MKQRKDRSRRSRRGEASVDPFGSRALMVCREARDALALALAEARDPGLAEARLLDVIPDPDLSRLRARVAAPAEACIAVREALARSHRYLRAAAMAELDRKHTPDLAFTVVPEEDA